MNLWRWLLSFPSEPSAAQAIEDRRQRVSDEETERRAKRIFDEGVEERREERARLARIEHELDALTRGRE